MPNSLSHQLSKHARLLAAGVGVACVASLGLVVNIDRQVASATGESAGNDSLGLRGFEEYTEPGGVWPPRQTEIVSDRPATTEELILPDAEVADLEAGDDAQGAEQRRLTAALGDRFERVASGPELDAKGQPQGDSVRTTYFSYSANATVEVVESGGRILAIDSTPAAQYQPPRTETEQERAVALAREALAAAGHARAADIEGYAILAFPHPDNDLPDPGTAQFNGRVLYVSFHVDALSDPEFAAWVDLTSERVLRSGPVS